MGESEYKQTLQTIWDGVFNKEIVLKTFTEIKYVYLNIKLYEMATDNITVYNISSTYFNVKQRLLRIVACAE